MLTQGAGRRPTSSPKIKVSSEPLADVIVHAREEIDRLYAIVRQQGYVVLLCDENGVAIHHRGDEARADEFKNWSIWLGGAWSEPIGSTNRHRDLHLRTTAGS